jgi:hypothetical protein
MNTNAQSAGPGERLNLRDLDCCAKKVRKF